MHRDGRPFLCSDTIGRYGSVGSGQKHAAKYKDKGRNHHANPQFHDHIQWFFFFRHDVIGNQQSKVEILRLRVGSKKFVQQGRSLLDAQSVH